VIVSDVQIQCLGASLQNFQSLPISKAILIFIVIVWTAASCNAQVTPLSFRPVAAEYSTALDRMIFVSAGPNLLHIYSAQSQADQTVALSAAPLSLAVSPDGLHAAVGHSSLVSYVNLSTGVVEGTVPIPAPAAGLALSSTWIYVFPGQTSTGSIALSINIGTGAVSSRSITFTGTATRYNAAVNSIYGTREGISPDDIERYDISSGPIANQTDSIYHGDFNICGPIFFSSAGDRIYTGCSTVFHASTDPSQDMRYIETIPGASSVRSLTDSASLGRIALIQGSPAFFPGTQQNDSVVLLYSADYLNPIGQFALADFAGGGKTFKANGKWVFFNASSTFLYAVDEADSTSGLLNDFAIQTIPITPLQCTVSINSSLNLTIGGDGAMGTANISAAPTCTYQASVDSSWLQVISGGYGSGNGTLTYLVRANPGPARTGTITIGNSSVTITQATQSPASLTGLPYNVTNASYSRPIDKLVLTSAMPNELHVYDPVSRADQMIPLPMAPISLSVTPDGRGAAVGHDGWVSFVDLQQNLVLNVFPIAERVPGIVSDGSGYAYLFTPSGAFSGGIYSMNAATGSTTSISNFYGVTVARLSVDGSSIYGGSSYLQKWTIQNGTLSPRPAEFFNH
jgi:hypothetical protein